MEKNSAKVYLPSSHLWNLCCIGIQQLVSFKSLKVYLENKFFIYVHDNFVT